jgi:hypothetical protein
MAEHEITVREYVCDSDETPVLARIDEAPDGYLGTIMVNHGDTIESRPWFACKKGCINRAVLAVIMEDAIRRVPQQESEKGAPAPDPRDGYVGEWDGEP